jgi:enoyl-CoA hydratase/carnithine racemase
VGWIKLISCRLQWDDIVTLSQQEICNAIDDELSNSLAEVISEIELDQHIRAAVAATDSSAFPAGADLREHATRDD